jgi:hypothetical protein
MGAVSGRPKYLDSIRVNLVPIRAYPALPPGGLTPAGISPLLREADIVGPESAYENHQTQFDQSDHSRY